MFAALSARREDPHKEQLLKLYWNRASVKRELRSLKTERFELLDKLKEQEGAIVRAQEQLEGLERLLANPLAAANAMVYFQLRHMWRVAAAKLEQFGQELQQKREARERAKLHESATAKRRRRLDAINDKVREILQERMRLIEEGLELERRLETMNPIKRVFRGPGIRKRMHQAKERRRALDRRIEEFNELIEKIEGEPLPEPEGLSLESRRLINIAIIALAQHLVVHFSEHGLAPLAKAATQRPVADMKFGDRRTCDSMVERIRERIKELKRSTSLADQVKRRTDKLIKELAYNNDTDAMPRADGVETISPSLDGGGLARRASDAPLKINVLVDDYWDLYTVLR